MASIRKTFNFRNGVQVDEDNLVVNSFGLVGIGTSVPTEVLDVRGTAKVVGVVTANQVFTNTLEVGLTPSGQLGIATIHRLEAGGNIVLNSGIITATSGVVTYYGDGGSLLNLPTSQWVDVDVGLGFTSIYAQGFVGVGTIDPRFLFQVSGNTDTSVNGFSGGVGISSGGNILASGIITAYSFSGFGTDIQNLNASNISSGILNLNRLPTLTNDKLPSNISVSGIISASSGFVGNLTGNVTGIASTARDLVSSARISIDHISSNTSSVGIATVNTRLYSDGSIGIKTNNPQSDIHVFNTTNSSLQITGEEISDLIIGRSINKTQNTAGLKFGNTSGLYPYSRNNAFDLINYDSGNFNYYIHYGNSSGINTGSFNWIYGKDRTNPLMSLTYDGKLGIGITNPSNNFEVIGNSLISGSIDIEQNLNVLGLTSVTNLIVANSIQADLVGNVFGNVISNSGVSTFNNLNVNGSLSVFDLSVPGSFEVGEDISQKLRVFPGYIGFKTDTTQYVWDGVDIDFSQAVMLSKGIAIGKTTFSSFVDFANAGKGQNVTIGGITYSEPGCFMVVPKVNTSGRGNIVQPVSGSIIYNTSTNRFQGYNGLVWQDFAAATVTGSVSFADVATYAETAGIATFAQRLTGTPNIVVGIITATSASFSGNVSIAGTLTYEDVTNIDAIGLVTARSGVRITSGGLVVTSGVSTFSGITTVTGPTLFAKQLNVSGVITAAQFIRSGGTSSQFLKADGSVDSTTYASQTYVGLSTIGLLSSTGNGSSLTGIVTSITAGSGISINQSTGNVTITATGGGGGGGGESYWDSTSAGIHTLSNVGIGTTNPTENLTVFGDARVTGILTVGSSSVTINGITDTIQVQNVESNRLSSNDANITGVTTSTIFSTGQNGLLITQNNIFSDELVTINSPFRVVGNFFVDGQQTVINTSQLQVTDKLINLGNVEDASPSNITADGGGIVLRGTTDKLFVWSNFTNSWSSNVNIDIGSASAYKINNENRLTYDQLTVPNANITGVITATEYKGDGSKLSNIITSIVAGSNINVSSSGGQVTISAAAIGGGGEGAPGINVYDNQGFIGFASAIDFGNNLIVSQLDTVSGLVTVTGNAGGGGESYWDQTSAGIHTLSNVGIGTTNPTSALTVSGNARITGILTASSFGSVNGTQLNISGVATVSQGRIQADSSANLRFGNVAAGSGSVRNIAIGDQVLVSLSGGQGRNIGIGELSYYDTTTGQYNIGIGERAGQKVSTGSYNVILGAYDGNSGGLDIRTSSNNVVLADGQGNIRQYINSSGNVGIKTTVVTEALTVAGIVSATGFYGTLNAGQLTGTLPAIDGSALIGVVATGTGVEVQKDGDPVGTAATINFGNYINVSFADGTAIISGNGLATYANVAGIATYAPNAGFATASNTSNYASFAGVSTVSGTSGYATTAGISSAVSGTININTTGIITATSFSGSGSGLTNLPAGQLTGVLPAIDGSALLNVTATGTGIVVEDDNANVGSAVTVNFGTGLDVTFSAGIATITASGGSLQSRTTVSGSTASISNNEIGNINITGFKSYALMRVGLSTAGWLRLYTDSASRDADVSRSQGEDPAPGSGVIAEVVTTGISTTQIISPFVMGGNLDNPADTTIYASIKNLSGSTQAITANLTILQLEA